MSYIRSKTEFYRQTAIFRARFYWDQSRIEKREKKLISTITLLTHAFVWEFRARNNILIAHANFKKGALCSDSVHLRALWGYFFYRRQRSLYARRCTSASLNSSSSFPVLPSNRTHRRVLTNMQLCNYNNCDVF